MDERSTDPPNEAGLHEYIDAEFTVAGLESPSREKGLRDALEKLPGLESLGISNGRVMAHYEPVLLNGSNWKRQSSAPIPDFRDARGGLVSGDRRFRGGK